MFLSQNEFTVFGAGQQGGVVLGEKGAKEFVGAARRAWCRFAGCSGGSM